MFPKRLSKAGSPYSRKALLAGTVAAGLALAVGALLLANSFMARQVVADSQVVHRSEALLGANEIAVLALSQALLLQEDHAFGVADASTADLALREAAKRVAELDLEADEFLDTGETAVAESDVVAHAVAAADDVLALLEARETERAATMLPERLADFETLRDEVTRVRNTATASVDASAGLAGQSGSSLTFLIALFVPAAAMLAYRWLAQGQVRVAEVELDARLEAEHEIARAKDEFIANVSHELRTPLTSIFGFSELLLEVGLVDPDSSMDLLKLINREASELTRMVEDILVLARAEGGTLVYAPGPCDVKSVVTDHLASLVDGDNIVVRIEGVQAWVDENRLRHIVRNLVSNAQRHGGDNIEVTAESAGPTVTLVVADDGPGVDEASEGRLFRAFFHEGEDPLVQGTLGMGLAAVHALATGMSGSVRYERVEGRTRFVVTVPSAESARAASFADRKAS